MSVLDRADHLAASGDLAGAKAAYQAAARQRISGAHERLCHTTALLNGDVLGCTASALKLLPTSSFLHSLDGQEALERGLIQRAASSYEAAASLQPSDVDALTNSGISLVAAGLPAQASIRLEAALALAPRSASLYTELARLREADLGATGAMDAACDARAHAARLEPNSAQHHLDLGNTFLSAQRPGDATASLRRALKLAPRLPSLQALALFGLGRALLSRGDSCGAWSELGKATALAPTDADHWHQHALATQRCLWSQQDDTTLLPAAPEELVAEARHAWRQAIALEPRRSDSLTMLHLSPTRAVKPLPPQPAPRWTVSATGEAATDVGTPSAITLEGATFDLSARGSSERALEVLQTVGAVRLSHVLPAALALALNDTLEGCCHSTYETTNTTLTNSGRRHVAVPLHLPAVSAALDALAPLLQPLLCGVLQRGKETCGALRIVESGLLTSSPGAPAQPLHTDTPKGGPPQEAPALKVQLSGAEISADSVPTRLYEPRLPASHAMLRVACSIPVGTSGSP